ncbi:MAG: hypothetical protein R2822_26370 [Spirosomataceae bacterium]
MTGILVAIPALFMDASLVTDLTSIGTLFAFCVGMRWCAAFTTRKT